MLNRMEMIRIFCSAADCSNFREAATRLGVSPQAVTRAINGGGIAHERRLDATRLAKLTLL